MDAVLSLPLQVRQQAFHGHTSLRAVVLSCLKHEGVRNYFLLFLIFDFYKPLKAFHACFLFLYFATQSCHLIWPIDFMLKLCL